MSTAHNAPGSAAPPKIAAILAGGQSRRFGSDKVFAKLHGKPLIEHVISTLESCGFEIVISTADLKKFAESTYKVVEDPIPGEGPLQALYGLLKELQCPRLLLVAVDMPLLAPAVINLLWQEGQHHDVTVLEYNNMESPIPGVFAHAVLPRAADCLEQQRRDLCALFHANLTTHVIPESHWHPLDPHGGSAANINTRDDLESVK